MIIKLLLLFIITFIPSKNYPTSYYSYNTIPKTYKPKLKNNKFIHTDSVIITYKKWNDTVRILLDTKIPPELIDSVFISWNWTRYKIINPFIESNFNTLIAFSDLADSTENIPYKFFGITKHVYGYMDTNVIEKSIVYLNLESLQTGQEFYETLTHEIGHVLLGDSYHSKDSLDIMYYKQTMLQKYYPTDNDKNELKKRYPEYYK